ncbi:MAG: hypothetical protein DIU52_014640 [bacterium]|nr:MAG: hypothetical protein DIU52_02885 [bacterium]
MREPTDELMEKVVRELSALPPVREEAIQRILDLAAQRRAAERRAQEPPAAEPPVHARRRVAPRWWIGVAAAATLAALIWVGIGRDDGVPSVPVNAPLAAADAAPRAEAGALAVADRIIADEAPRAVQFVLDAPGARSVAVVGGFNGWDPQATPLERVPGTTVWTTTVLLTPGRYTYAFVVDDSTWVLDPRAPRASDPDYGVDSSVLLVGRE